MVAKKNGGERALELIRLLESTPGGLESLRRVSASSYEEFVEALYDDLDRMIVELESNTKHRHSDSEDRTTVEIVSMLRTFGYAAFHDAQTGGHVDITVENQRKGYKWLGEAKIFGHIGDLRDGFSQLETRYSNGAPGQDQGGILAYLKRTDAAGKMSGWRKEFAKIKNGAKFFKCQKRKELAFYSEHKHPISGRAYRVRHMCVLLHFDPDR